VASVQSAALKRLRQRDADDGRRPGALERARLRRRLVRQERVREALLLELGAIIFELHRQGRREPELLRAKAADLADVDVEVRTLTKALGEGQSLPELTARGLVAACTACGAIMGVRDRHCPNCGAAAGAPAGLEDGEYEPAALEEPEYDEGEIDAHAAAREPVGADGRPASNGDLSPWYGEPPRPSAPLQDGHDRQDQRDPPIPLAQRTLRAGRRLARSWIEERRSGGR
jgi:hypothetical protein